MGVAGAEPRCRNCESPLAGPYCAECGQRDLPPDPTLRELLAEAWDAFVSVDGKVVRSARLLFLRPGALTTEYLAGRRASYVPPLRLYLVASVLYFLVASALPGRPPVVTKDLSPRAARGDRPDQVARAFAIRDSQRLAVLDSLRITHAATGPLDSAQARLADSLLTEGTVRRELGVHPGSFQRMVLARFIRNAGRATRDERSFGTSVKQQVPRMMFALMPAFAALLMLAYRARRRRYPTHLVVSLHLHAFFFAAITVFAVLDQMPWQPVRVALACALVLWLTAYVPLALRRVYGGRLRWAVARGAFVTGIYALLGGAALVSVAMLVILLY